MDNLEKTLHVTTQGRYIRLEVDALRAERDDGTIIRFRFDRSGSASTAVSV